MHNEHNIPRRRHFLHLIDPLLQANRPLQRYVGFRDAPGYPNGNSPPSRVAWLKMSLHSKYSTSAELYKRPDIVKQYRREWASWFDHMPAAVWSYAAAQGIILRGSSDSVLQHGFFTCESHSLIPTVEEFLAGVSRALLLTPAFALVAMLIFLQDIFLCYAALYTIVSMSVTILGLLFLLGLTLGPIESLAFALVVGVSVDYLVHFAYAFKHSVMAESYFKTRAVVMARSGSTCASGMTTLAAVLPLLGAAILPLRMFGMIFTVVSCVALVFALGFFNAILMVAGPGCPLPASCRPPALVNTTCTRSSGRSQAEPTRLIEQVERSATAVALADYAVTEPPVAEEPDGVSHNIGVSRAREETELVAQTERVSSQAAESAKLSARKRAEAGPADDGGGALQHPLDGTVVWQRPGDASSGRSRCSPAQTPWAPSTPSRSSGRKSSIVAGRHTPAKVEPWMSSF